MWETKGRLTVTRRRAGFFLIFGALVPLAVAATAWACGNLATLRGPGVAAPGSTITVTGSNYQDNTASPTGSTPVQIRLDSRTGPVLADNLIPSGPRRAISAQVSLAGVSPGYHVLQGTQWRKSDGFPASGTPGRTTIRVQGSSASSSSGSSWGSPGAPVKVDAGGPGGSAPMSTLLGVGLSLALLGIGSTLVARSRRAARRPALGA